MNDFSLLRRAFLALLAAAPLAACTETAGDLSARSGPPRRAPGLTLALTSLSGAPEAAIATLSSALVSEAQKRDMLIVGVDTKPRYQARGHLALTGEEGGRRELSYAFDIYDQTRARAKRIAGALPLSGGQDWAAVTPQVAERIASATLDEFAAFVVDTTTLVAGASGPATPARGVAALLTGQ
jgi:hypothetical protein